MKMRCLTSLLRSMNPGELIKLKISSSETLMGLFLGNYQLHHDYFVMRIFVDGVMRNFDLRYLSCVQVLSDKQG